MNEPKEPRDILPPRDFYPPEGPPIWRTPDGKGRPPGPRGYSLKKVFENVISRVGSGRVRCITVIVEDHKPSGVSLRGCREPMD